MNSKCRRQKNVDFPGLDFLKVARCNFGPFSQCILRQLFAHPFAAHIGTKELDSLPFFPGNGHDILHRDFPGEMNDTYIVKCAPDCHPPVRREAPKDIPIPISPQD